MGLKNIIDRYLKKKKAFHFFVLGLGGAICLIVLIVPLSSHSSQYFLSIGNVAPQDFQASFTKTYTSSILTDQAMLTAEEAIQPVFLPVDPKISRDQIADIRTDLNYINNVRADEFSTQAQKISDIDAMENLDLTEEIAKKIITFPDQEWQSIQSETTRVLEQVMRTTIREDKLPEVQKTAPSLISFTLSEDQFITVTELIRAYIVPNSIYSEELTLEARQAARENVEPVLRTYVEGETIINSGEVITPEKWEALVEFGIVEPTSNNQTYFARVALVSLICAFLAVYFFRRNVKVIHETKNLLLIFINFFLFFISARFILPGQDVIPYLFPLPAFGLLVSFLLNLEVGMVFSIILAVLSSYGLSNSLDLTIFYIFTSFFGILALNRGRRIANFFWASIAIGTAGSCVIFAYRLPAITSDMLKLSTLLSLAILNGLASASIALLLQFIYSQILGITTPLRLLDISRPDHPLLQQILLHAPGTYQHSLQVANLAEQAAKAINADALLVRVGALYHDSGKSLNPSFFIENQLPGFRNPHDDLDPKTSAKIIIQHVADGILLAKKHRIPPRIQDFILEHHGTLIAPYQYTKAVEKYNHGAAEIKREDFQYPGPSPRSRETAILMIADGIEARFRAMPPKDEKELRLLLQKTIDFLTSEHQLIHTNLTLNELNLISESIYNTLVNTRHMRIQYPELSEK